MVDPWFVPRRFGYGATPVTWQGWAVVLGGIAPLLLNSLWWRSRTGAILGWAVLAASIAIAYAKTDGPWRWRW